MDRARSFNLGRRPRTVASADWDVEAWTHQHGLQTSVDFTAVIDEALLGLGRIVASHRRSPASHRNR